MKIEYAICCALAVGASGAFATFGRGLDEDVAGETASTAAPRVRLAAQAGAFEAAARAGNALAHLDDLPASLEGEARDVAALGARLGLEKESVVALPFAIATYNSKASLFRRRSFDELLAHLVDEPLDGVTFETALADPESEVRASFRAAAFMNWRELHGEGAETTEAAVRRGVRLSAPHAPDAAVDDFFLWVDEGKAFAASHPMIAESVRERTYNALRGLGSQGLIGYARVRLPFEAERELGFGIDFGAVDAVLEQWYAPVSEVEATAGIREVVDRNLRLMSIGLYGKQRELRRLLGLWGEGAASELTARGYIDKLETTRRSVRAALREEALSRQAVDDLLFEYRKAVLLGASALQPPAQPRPFTVMSSTTRFAEYREITSGWRQGRHVTELPLAPKQVATILQHPEVFHVHDWGHVRIMEPLQRSKAFQFIEDAIAALEREGDPIASELREMQAWTIHEDPTLRDWRNGFLDGIEPAPKSPDARKAFAKIIAEYDTAQHANTTRQ